MRNTYFLLFMLLIACLGCEWKLHSSGQHDDSRTIVIERYDQLEQRYLSTGDIAALQQMNTEYPETRLLVEDLLQLGPANDPGIKNKLLLFFQDSTLQKLISDVESEYSDMNDIEEQLSDAFSRLQQLLPDLPLPRVYTQISSLDQSIVAGDGFLGISLDKYLGTDYPLYLRYGYTARQRSMMNRSFIVPDCLGFYLLSHYPFNENDTTRASRNCHMGRIQHVVNQALRRQLFTNEAVLQAEKLMQSDKSITPAQLLQLQ